MVVTSSGRAPHLKRAECQHHMLRRAHSVRIDVSALRLGHPGPSVQVLARLEIANITNLVHARPAKREAANFLSAELPPLFGAITPGVYRMICETALKTGAREAELIAATWGDLDLAEAVLRIRHTRTDGHLHEPKSHVRRDVDLTEDLVALLGHCWGELGRPADSTVIFPGATPSGYLDASTLRRELYRAMKAAGIDRVGPTGEKQTFQSLRHTYAKRSLEVGAQITWLSPQLGHSRAQVTTGVYGHWERGERRKQAQQLAGTFGV